MTTLPDRMSVDPTSSFHDADLLGKGIGIRFKGVERTDVEEYCVSENWIRVGLGKKVDRHGRPLTIKLSGPVEVRVLGNEDAAHATSASDGRLAHSDRDDDRKSDDDEDE